MIIIKHRLILFLEVADDKEIIGDIFILHILADYAFTLRRPIEQRILKMNT
jgi:hypothetical protein